jgi:2-keto-3-deoxy-6-phosphogluconate aldolase
MNTLSQSILGLMVGVVSLISVTSRVQAVSPTPPLLDTRVECVSGADGKQVCRTVTIERTSSNSAKPVVSPTATPKVATPTVSSSITTTPGATTSGQVHTVVNTGLQENLIALLFAVFSLSAFGYKYAKAKTQ